MRPEVVVPLVALIMSLAAGVSAYRSAVVAGGEERRKIQRLIAHAEKDVFLSQDCRHRSVVPVESAVDPDDILARLCTDCGRQLAA